VKSPLGHLAAIDEEIAGEKAGSLGRVAAKLEARLAAIADIATRLPTLPPLARAAAREEHERLRQEAKLYLWYLQVQREAMGLYDNAVLFRLYQIPARLR
jgi:hypothetical protein